jgi:hypothetical protein
MFQIHFLDIKEAKNNKDNALVNETKDLEDAQGLTVTSDGKLPTKKRKRVSRACKKTLLVFRFFFFLCLWAFQFVDP